LDAAPRNAGEAFNYDNVDEFVDRIHQQALVSDKPIRVQLAIRTSNVHWTAVDLEISKEGVKSLQIDAAADPSSLVGAQIFQKILHKFPDPSKCKSYFLRHGAIPSDELKQQSIQYDDASCSQFALDILFHLSNLDSFSIMEQRERDLAGTSSAFKIPLGSPNERFFKASNMPPELAVIYRNTQSKESFGSLPPQLHKQVINKKGETLASSEARHTELLEVKAALKPRNQAIHHKREGYIRDVRTMLSQHPDFSVKVEGRDVLTSMRDGAFSSSKTFDQINVAAKLISEARTIESGKSSWGLGRVYNRVMNGYALSKAEHAVEVGRPLEAIGCLEKMRDLTSTHKQQLANIREKFGALDSAKDDTPDQTVGKS